MTAAAPQAPTPSAQRGPGRTEGSQPRPRKPRRPAQALPLLLPALVPVVIFNVWPLLQGIYLGFTDARAGLNQVTSFTGLENYRDLAGNSLFWSSFRIGMIWAFSVTGLQFVAGLGLALLLNEDLRLRWLARTLALVPWAMPPVVVAIMWRLMLNPGSGPISTWASDLGLADNLNLLGNFSTALPAVIVVGVWAGMPQTTITLLAGLQSIDGSLHEAAAIDGAGSFRRFWHVTLPGLRPVIIAITSLDFIWNFNSLSLVYVLTNGGPGGRTMLPMLFAYNEAFRYGNFGIAAAMGNIIVIVVMAILLFYLRSRLRRDA